MKTELPPRDYHAQVPFPDRVECVPIGVVRSVFTERNGTPRQAGLPDVRGRDGNSPGRVELFPDLVPRTALQDLAGFDRVWLITWLHLNRPGFRPMVRPPRGGQRRGVLATRSPHRPNPIGLSAVRLDRVEGHTLHLIGLDLIDGTPVLDVKPYVVYCDAFPEASSGWVDEMGGKPEIG